MYQQFTNKLLKNNEKRLSLQSTYTVTNQDDIKRIINFKKHPRIKAGQEKGLEYISNISSRAKS